MKVNPVLFIFIFGAFSRALAEIFLFTKCLLSEHRTFHCAFYFQRWMVVRFLDWFDSFIWWLPGCSLMMKNRVSWCRGTCRWGWAPAGDCSWPEPPGPRLKSQTRSGPNYQTTSMLTNSNKAGLGMNTLDPFYSKHVAMHLQFILHFSNMVLQYQ